MRDLSFFALILAWWDSGEYFVQLIVDSVNPWDTGVLQSGFHLKRSQGLPRGMIKEKLPWRRQVFYSLPARENPRTHRSHSSTCTSIKMHPPIAGLAGTTSAVLSTEGFEEEIPKR